MLEFYKDKKVLITGHNGFKGSWLCQILKMSGAFVIGYSLEPPAGHKLFSAANISQNMVSIFGDIRDLGQMEQVFEKYHPDIVLHLAAQPIVRESYYNPVYTYETNVMGTVHLMECVRKFRCVKSVVNVTTDKVYENQEWYWGYRENERLNGYDPYSNSKSCSELVTDSYKKSFFYERIIGVSTARAGNVIGGGDYAKGRIMPDCIQAAKAGNCIKIRNPNAVRPFQHVMEPLMAYLLIAKKQWENYKLQGSYNVGPDEKDAVSVSSIVEMFCECWGEGQKWLCESEAGFHEANLLTLDCSKIKKKLGWKPVWNIRDAVVKTVEWEKEYMRGRDATAIMQAQIDEYIEAQNNIGERGSIDAI